jgi:hypothetical protein
MVARRLARRWTMRTTWTNWTRSAAWIVTAVTMAGCSEEIIDGDPQEDEVTFRIAMTDLEDGLELHLTGDTTCFGGYCYAVDASDNAYFGTLIGGVSTIASPWGNALSFDGVNDRIALSSDLSEPATFGGSGGAFTISARVRVDDADKSNRLCHGCGPVAGMHVGHATDGRVARVTLRDTVNNQNVDYHSQASYGPVIPEDEWVQVTMTVDATASPSVSFQLDCARGQSVLLQATPDPYVPIIKFQWYNANIGLYDYGNTSMGDGNIASGWFDGEVDDLRIWSRVLSDDERAMLCSDPADPPCEEADPPNPPDYVVPFELPGGGCSMANCNDPAFECVSNATELQTVITNDVYTDIVLCDGAYSRDAYLQVEGHRLWAESEGGAVLNFGIVAGGGGAHAGAEFHGLVFDISDPDHVNNLDAACDPPGAAPPVDLTKAGMALSIWGNASDAVVMDCTFNGHGMIGYAIHANEPEGLHIERVVVSDFARQGISAGHPNIDHSLLDPMILRDIRIDRISDPSCWGVECTSCGYGEGTQETGMTIYDTADVDRVRVRDVRTTGIATGEFCDGTTLTDIDVDRSGIGHANLGTGVTFEGTTRDTALSEFCVGSLTRIGVLNEWDLCTNPSESDDYGPKGINNLVTDGSTESWLFGVVFNQGTVDSEVSNVVMSDYHRAGVLIYNNYTTEPEEICPDDAYDDGSAQVSNTFLETENEVAGICSFTRSESGDMSPDCL